MPVSDERLLSVLQSVAPGTALREGVDRIMNAGKGAIIVLGAGESVQSIISGGFQLDTKFTAQRLSEVAKMDGAIIVDDDVERILYANVHLVPDNTIPTRETGTRHRTSERTAKHTGVAVVCVSEAMRIVNLYIDDRKHTLEPISSILTRANQAIATLERYRSRLEQVSEVLETLELENVVTLRDLLSVLQRSEMVRRIADEIEGSIVELGTAGRLLQLQLDELMAGVEDAREVFARDYVPDRRRRIARVLAELDAIPAEELLELQTLAEVLGFGPDARLDQPVASRGYRVLNRIPRLPARAIDAIVERFSSLPKLLEATLSDLDAVDGIGSARARAVKAGLMRLEEQNEVDRLG